MSEVTNEAVDPSSLELGHRVLDQADGGVVGITHRRGNRRAIVVGDRGNLPRRAPFVAVDHLRAWADRTARLPNRTGANARRGTDRRPPVRVMAARHSTVQPRAMANRRPNLLSRIWGRILYGRPADSMQATSPGPIPGDGDGIFEGLFVASRAELDGWDKEGMTPPDWPGTEWKSLTIVELAQLEALATGDDAEIIISRGEDPVAWVGSDEGAWVLRVRDPLIDALVAMSPDALVTLADRWAETPEMRYPGTPTPETMAAHRDQVRVLVADMVDAMRQARAGQREVFTIVRV